MRPAKLPIAAAIVLAAATSVAATESVARGDELSSGAKPCAIDEIARPCVLLGHDRLEGLRLEIAEPGPKKDFYEKHLRPNADLWLGRHIVIPARAGHYHNFTCVDGTRLTLPGTNQDMESGGPYQCPACGRTYEGEKFDGAVRNQRHVWLMTGCRDMALAYALTGERKYADKAAEVLRKYADAYPGRHTGVTEGGIFYQSLDESMHIIVLAQAYDLIAGTDVLTDADRRHIERNLFWECAAGLVRCGARTNWGSWHLSAVGVIGVATRHQALIDYGVTKFKAQIRDELGSDGLWPESVHTYHFFPLRAMLFLAEACANAGIDLYHWGAGGGKGLKVMFTAPIAYAYPDLRLPAINDGWFESFMPIDQYTVAWHRYHLPEFAWVISERRKEADKASAGSATRDEIWSFVIGEKLPDHVAPPALRSRDFSNIGISVLRTDPGQPGRDGMMLTFDYGRHLGHGQLDKMGITVFGNHRLLAADYGTPSYGSAILVYYLGTWSHNTIVVDGQNQERTKTGERIALSDTPLLKASCARTEEAYPGVNWRRCLLLVDNDYALVVDDLESTASHDYDWLFHCEGKRLDTSGLDPATTHATLACEQYTDVTTHTAAGSGEQIRWSADDGSGLALISALERGDLVFTARCPAETSVRTIPVAALRKTGKKARFASAICLFASAGEVPALPRIQMSDDGNIVVSSEDREDRLAIDNTSIILRSRRGTSTRSAEVKFGG